MSSLFRNIYKIIMSKLGLSVIEEKQKAQRTDKKLQQKIQDKKQAHGLKM